MFLTKTEVGHIGELYINILSIAFYETKCQLDVGLEDQYQTNINH